MSTTTRLIAQQNFSKFITCENFKSHRVLKDLHFTHGVYLRVSYDFQTGLLILLQFNTTFLANYYVFIPLAPM
jgi:hypothetical protein